MLRYAIANPEDRLFSRFTADSILEWIFWTLEEERVSWYRSRPRALKMLAAIQVFEPEARLVEQETEDL